MGNQSNLKQLRGQIRIIVKEILPEILTTEVVAAIERVISTKVDARLNNIDDRQKDLQSFMVRQRAQAIAQSVAPKPEEETPVAPAADSEKA